MIPIDNIHSHMGTTIVFRELIKVKLICAIACLLSVSLQEHMPYQAVSPSLPEFHER